MAPLIEPIWSWSSVGHTEKGFQLKINLLTHYSAIHFKQHLLSYVDQKTYSCKLCNKALFTNDVYKPYHHPILQIMMLVDGTVQGVLQSMIVDENL